MDDNEQDDVLAAASVAVPQKVVVLSSGTTTLRPGEAKAEAEPVAATGEVQVLFVYRRTVEPASALPRTSGLLSFAGDDGLVEVKVGEAGGVVPATVVSCTQAMDDNDQDDVVAAATVAAPSRETQ